MTLAGPVEFTPQDIALILAVLIALALLLTAPGWLLVGVASAKRAAQRGVRRGWAFVGGALLGMAITAAAGAVVVPLVDAVGEAGRVVALPVLWGACWAIAWLIWPRPTTHDAIRRPS